MTKTRDTRCARHYVVVYAALRSQRGNRRLLRAGEGRRRFALLFVATSLRAEPRHSVAEPRRAANAGASIRHISRARWRQRAAPPRHVTAIREEDVYRELMMTVKQRGSPIRHYRHDTHIMPARPSSSIRARAICVAAEVLRAPKMLYALCAQCAPAA